MSFISQQHNKAQCVFPFVPENAERNEVSSSLISCHSVQFIWTQDLDVKYILNMLSYWSLKWDYVIFVNCMKWMAME